MFEANRVSDIITTLPDVRWKYVPTHDNPADCATRGLSAQDLKQFTLWWAGPSWLQSLKNWPNQLDLANKDLVDKLDISNFNTNSALLTKPAEITWLNKFSSFSRLTRVIALARRWLPGQQIKSDFITARELEAASVRILKMDQKQHFTKEIALLKSNNPIPRKSKLARLKPLLDDQGLLRVGSRVENCPFLSYEEKYPIILDRRSSISRMLAWDYHRIYLHGGPKLVFAAISRR